MGRVVRFCGLFHVGLRGWRGNHSGPNSPAMEVKLCENVLCVAIYFFHFRHPVGLAGKPVP